MLPGLIINMLTVSLSSLIILDFVYFLIWDNRYYRPRELFVLFRCLKFNTEIRLELRRVCRTVIQGVWPSGLAR